MQPTKLKNLVNSPIRKNIVANIFGIGVNLCNQILLVPVFLHFWGTDLYSDWIVISAISSFFMLSEVGINSIVQNRFVIKYSQNDIRECQALLNCNLIIITGLFVLSIIGALIYLDFYDIKSNLHLVSISKTEASKVFIFLLIQVFALMYMGVPNSIFRAFQKNYLAVFIDHIARLSWVIVTMVCIISNTSIVLMSALLSIPYVILFFVKFFITQKYFKIKLGLAGITIRLLREIFLLGAGFLSFPLANAILLQGFTLIVNKYFGSSSVVLYNTTRTMCNFIKTLLNSIQNSVWPEYSIAYGLKNIDRMKYLYYKAIRISFVLSLIISAVLLLVGPIIYNIWTSNMVHFSYSLMCSFLVVLIVNTLWNTGSVVLLSTNNHSQFGLLNIISTSVALVVAIILAKYTHSLSAVVYSTLVIDIILTGYVHKKFRRLIAKVQSEIELDKNS